MIPTARLLLLKASRRQISRSFSNAFISNKFKSKEYLKPKPLGLLNQVKEAWFTDPYLLSSQVKKLIQNDCITEAIDIVDRHFKIADKVVYSILMTELSHAGYPNECIDVYKQVFQ